MRIADRLRSLGYCPLGAALDRPDQSANVRRLEMYPNPEMVAQKLGISIALAKEIAGNWDDACDVRFYWLPNEQRLRYARSLRAARRGSLGRKITAFVRREWGS